MSASQGQPLRIQDRAAYHEWTRRQVRGRYERIEGAVVAMAPERIAHVRVKARVWQALDRALRSAQVDCEALADGVTIEIGDDTDYEPDAVVNCGKPVSGDVVSVPCPVIIVEVLSPGTAARDAGVKLVDYFRLATVQHYVLFYPDRAQVIQHKRLQDNQILTSIISAGDMEFTPPGIRIALADIYPP